LGPDGERSRPGCHAVLLVDQAGWHMSDRLVVSINIMIVLLPPKCPELNPVENIWQFMRDNWHQIACSNPTMTSSTIPAMPGTSSSINRNGPLFYRHVSLRPDELRQVLVDGLLDQ
jgi:hypothetical protein